MKPTHEFVVRVKASWRLGCPEINPFEAVMMRIKPKKGFIVGFGFTSEVNTEISQFFKRTGKVIVALTVGEILDEEIAQKLA